jgi:Ala-tRNA(Pro) deacylase
MPINRRLKEFLDQSGKPYHVHAHAEAYTAQELAAVEHVPGREMVKVVMLRGGEMYYMAALCANCKVDLARLGKTLGKADLRLATEREFQELFPGCETGAMPPFGNLFNLALYLDKKISENAEITFQAGTHRESIRMKLTDYLALATPHVADFAIP